MEAQLCTESGQPSSPEHIECPFVEMDRSAPPPAGYDVQTLYEQSLQGIQEGKIITGDVVKIEKETVFVDIGYKSEGGIPLSEFLDSDGNLTVTQGDKVDVVLVRRADEKGYPILSRERVPDVKRSLRVEEAFKKKTPLKGKILSQVKGGYVVDLGLHAFLPTSQVDLFPSGDPGEWIGTEHDFQVLSYDRRRPNIIVSRKSLLQEERQHLREKTLNLIQEGAVLRGHIKKIMEYGLLVDLGGVLGLVYITNVSWVKIRNLQERFHLNDEVRVKVLEHSGDKGRVSLGMKQLEPDPWPDMEKKYPAGTKVEVPVVALKKYGVFVELEGGVEGLIPTSELSWRGKVTHPSQVLKVGDTVEAIVTGVYAEKRQISLSKKDAERNPWDTIEEKYPIGTVIAGRIKKVKDFGIFVGIEEGVDALIHQSDISWSDPTPHPLELYKAGQEVQAVVISIDKEKRHFSLSIKHLTQKEKFHRPFAQRWEQVEL